MKKTLKKVGLEVKVETIRQLTDKQLDSVAGGLTQQTIINSKCTVSTGQ